MDSTHPCNHPSQLTEQALEDVEIGGENIGWTSFKITFKAMLRDPNHLGG